MKITKEENTKNKIKALQAATRVEASVTRRKNVAFQDKRTKRNRTRGAQKRKAIKEAL